MRVPVEVANNYTTVGLAPGRRGAGSPVVGPGEGATDIPGPSSGANPTAFEELPRILQLAPERANVDAPYGGVGGGSSAGTGYLEAKLLAKTVTKCPGFVLLGGCDNGHRYMKEIYCGREWCPRCGADWSEVHRRRFVRLLKRARQIKKMGYLVITFPEEVRWLKGYLYSRRGIKIVTELILRVIAGRRSSRRRREGGYWSRGFLRWHWFGDKTPGKYHPHVNAIVEGGYLPEEKLVELRRRLKEVLKLPREPEIHYAYTEDPGQMIHWLKYITRATFRCREWDEYMAEELYGFRNGRYWGKWDGEPVWGRDEVEDEEWVEVISELEFGVCPVCGEFLRWSSPLPIVFLDVWVGGGLAKELGAGYWVLEWLPPV